MNISTPILLIYIFTWAIWTWWFVYGRSQKMIIATVSWIALCVYPYFTDNIYTLIITGIILTILPFYIQY